MWLSIFVTVAFFKVTLLPAGTERGGRGPREMADRERASLTAQAS